MPQYKLKPGQKAFHKGQLYDANGKRPVLTTDEPLDPVPSSVIPLVDESKSATAQAIADDAAKKAAADLKAANAAAKKAAAEKAAADKAAAAPGKPDAPTDQAAEITAVNFTDTPRAGAVETL